MPFDGVALYAAVHEIRNNILGYKINKIYQPKKDLLIISLRHGSEEKSLLISVNPVNCRIHLTENLPENPLNPPMFCMLLRKHLVGGKVQQIHQLGLERIVQITVQNVDEFMQPVEFKLIVEIMGKHSNIILIDPSSSLIVDSIKRVTSYVNRHRQILPNEKYVLPPIGQKCNLLLVDNNYIMSLFVSAVRQGIQKSISSWILENFMGLNGTTAREAAYRANIDDNTCISLLPDDKLNQAVGVLADLQEKIRECSFCPTIYFDGIFREPVDFWVLPMVSKRELIAVQIDGVNKAIDCYYLKKEQTDAIKSRKMSLGAQILKLINKKIHNITLIKSKLNETSEMKKFKLWGEILSTYLFSIKTGAKEAVLPNFYDPGNDIVIPLNNKITPAQNAQKYFNKYKKLQSTKNIIQKRLMKLTEEMDYLENVLVNIHNSTSLEDIYEIQQELIDQGYMIKRKAKSLKKHTSQPLRFKSSDGFDIYVGKNNTQNDTLTLKTAKPEDIWLHTKNIPGSHVVIECHGKAVSEQALEEAGCLAAYFSKARNGNKVPVDFTFVKNVRKPAGAKPGFVIYDNYKTIYVNPDSSLTETLLF
jgi:predicted ribosome quality control (RQC) complex YloA/Tae2 family protein